MLLIVLPYIYLSEASLSLGVFGYVVSTVGLFVLLLKRGCFK